MKFHRIVAACLVINCSTALAGDVTGFSVRGVKPGDDAMDACDKFAELYPREGKLKERMGVKAVSSEIWISGHQFINKGSKQNVRDGCRGGYVMYDRRIDGPSNVKNDSGEIWVNLGKVYAAKSTQRMTVGDNLQACIDQRKSIVQQLVAKYGEPRAHRKGEKGGSTYEHLIWDYSGRNDARHGDEDYEYFDGYIQCNNYSKDYSVGQMTLQTTVHSGKAIVDSRQSVKVSTPTFKPQL